jgi:hypothetical protein
MCQLWKTESGHRESRRLTSSTRFAPHHPNFLGALSTSHGEPQTRTTLVPLTIEGVLPPVAGGHMARVFGRLIAASTPLLPPGTGWTRGCVVKWGAERGVRKKTHTRHALSKAMSVRMDIGQPLLAVTQHKMRVRGPALSTRCLLPPILFIIRWRLFGRHSY